ncbi:MAG: S41 family peptidase [Anaerolineae bacterium]|nr:S41 family peptidase [Anaerolineae bacterium]
MRRAPFTQVTRSLITLSALSALLITLFVAGYTLGASDRTPVSAQGDGPTEETGALFEPFWETWTLLHENYVDPLDDEALMEGALRGMLGSLGDQNTDYMDPETFAQVNESMGGSYEGIGATVRQNEVSGGLELVSIMAGSPAEAAGLRAGDTIVEVDGVDVTRQGQNEIIAKVRGPAGSVVRLGVRRPGAAEMLHVDVTRDRIKVSSVTSEVLDGNIGYVRLNQFEFSTGQAMREAIEAMGGDALSGLILDVRANPGGYLTTAIDVASAFIDSGPVVIERAPDREYTHEALGNAIATHVPMVVLVDEGSASASELIAGALQDRDRATIIGMPTFGKGSVQIWRELSNGGGVRITISRWYTPDGHSVSDVGITPDIEVAFDPVRGLEDDTQIEAAIDFLTEPRAPRVDAPAAPVPSATPVS